MTDEMVQDAVVRNLQIMAESTQKISEGAKNENPEVEWRAIGGFRNVLVHDYLGLDVEEVWSIVETDLPRLRTQMEAIAARLISQDEVQE